MMLSFLVTGGAGFIGSHLVDRLVEAGHSVQVLDNLSTGRRANLNPSAGFTEGDIRDEALVREMMTGMDGCFHLAAVASVQASNEKWAETHQVNLTGAINVFDAARQAGRLPVVYASSAAVYGDTPDMPLSEASQTRPLTAYGADKYGCELHAVPAHLVHGVVSTGMRFFNVYGPRQDPASPYSGVISIFADRLLRGLDITINGDGKQTRDFVYVADVCQALIAAMETRAKHPRVFNVCTGQGTSILALAETLAELTGQTGGVGFGPARAGDIPSSVGDNTALIRDLGVHPETDLHEGLAQTLDYMRDAIGAAQPLSA